MTNVRTGTRARSRFAVTVAFTVAACGAAEMALAQVGSGWTQYAFTVRRVHREGAGAFYEKSGGVETFRVPSGAKRSEIHTGPNWTSGQRQFQGEVKTTSGSGESAGSSIVQVFGIAGRNSDAFQLRVTTANGGTYRTQTDNNPHQVVATGVYGKWTRVNVIHDANGNRLYCYINGSQKFSGVDGGNASHYFKYGMYIRPGQSQWRSVKTFRK
jgi:hypothetical protein